MNNFRLVLFPLAILVVVIFQGTTAVDGVGAGDGTDGVVNMMEKVPEMGSGVMNTAADGISKDPSKTSEGGEGGVGGDAKVTGDPKDTGVKGSAGGSGSAEQKYRRGKLPPPLGQLLKALQQVQRKYNGGN